MPRAAPGQPHSPAGHGTGPSCPAAPRCMWGLVMAVQRAALGLPEWRPGACCTELLLDSPVYPWVPISSAAPSHFPLPALPYDLAAARPPRPLQAPWAPTPVPTTLSRNTHPVAINQTTVTPTHHEAHPPETAPWWLLLWPRTQRTTCLPCYNGGRSHNRHDPHLCSPGHPNVDIPSVPQNTQPHCRPGGASL